MYDPKHCNNYHFLFVWSDEGTKNYIQAFKKLLVLIKHCNLPYPLDGICHNLDSCLQNEEICPCPYQFIGACSNGYSNFDKLNKQHDYRWRGFAKDYRTEWCKLMLQELESAGNITLRQFVEGFNVEAFEKQVTENAEGCGWVLT